MTPFSAALLRQQLNAVYIDSNISLRRLAGRSSAFSPQSNCAKVFHVAMHNIDSMDAFGWKTAFLPLNCFLWIFVRQFHFTSRHATPTFITLFKAHFPTTARKLLFLQYAGRSNFHVTR
jgi:hypothetical protein